MEENIPVPAEWCERRVLDLSPCCLTADVMLMQHWACRLRVNALAGPCTCPRITLLWLDGRRSSRKVQPRKISNI